MSTASETIKSRSQNLGGAPPVNTSKGESYVGRTATQAYKQETHARGGSGESLPGYSPGFTGTEGTKAVEVIPTGAIVEKSYGDVVTKQFVPSVQTQMDIQQRGKEIYDSLSQRIAQKAQADNVALNIQKTGVPNQQSLYTQIATAKPYSTEAYLAQERLKSMQEPNKLAYSVVPNMTQKNIESVRMAQYGKKGSTVLPRAVIEGIEKAVKPLETPYKPPATMISQYEPMRGRGIIPKKELPETVQRILASPVSDIGRGLWGATGEQFYGAGVDIKRAQIESKTAGEFFIRSVSSPRVQSTALQLGLLGIGTTSQIGVAVGRSLLGYGAISSVGKFVEEPSVKTATEAGYFFAFPKLAEKGGELAYKSNAFLGETINKGIAKYINPLIDVVSRKSPTPEPAYRGKGVFAYKYGYEPTNLYEGKVSPPSNALPYETILRIGEVPVRIPKSEFIGTPTSDIANLKPYFKQVAKETKLVSKLPSISEERKIIRQNAIIKEGLPSSFESTPLGQFISARAEPLAKETKAYRQQLAREQSARAKELVKSEMRQGFIKPTLETSKSIRKAYRQGIIQTIGKPIPFEKTLLGKTISAPAVVRKINIPQLSILAPEKFGNRDTAPFRKEVKILYTATNLPPSQKLVESGKVYGFTDLNLARGWQSKMRYRNIYKFVTGEFTKDTKVYSRRIIIGGKPKNIQSSNEFIARDVLGEELVTPNISAKAQRREAGRLAKEQLARDIEAQFNPLNIGAARTMTITPEVTSRTRRAIRKQILGKRSIKPLKIESYPVPVRFVRYSITKTPSKTEIVDLISGKIVFTSEKPVKIQKSIKPPTEKKPNRFFQQPNEVTSGRGTVQILLPPETKKTAKQKIKAKKVISGGMGRFPSGSSSSGYGGDLAQYGFSDIASAREGRTSRAGIDKIFSALYGTGLSPRGKSKIESGVRLSSSTKPEIVYIINPKANVDVGLKPITSAKIEQNIKLEQIISPRQNQEQNLRQNVEQIPSQEVEQIIKQIPKTIPNQIPRQTPTQIQNTNEGRIDVRFSPNISKVPLT